MTPLLPHQTDAITALAEHKGRMLLFADCGTGKTAIALAACERIKEYNRPMLFLCPSIVKRQVADEARRFCTLPCVVIEGDRALRGIRWQEVRKYTTSVIVVANYELLVHDFKELSSIEWLFIVADECQRIVSPTAKSTKALKKLSATFRLAMSGTPAPNYLHDYWSLIDWLEPGALGKSFWEFRNRECITSPYIPQKIMGYRDEPRLRAIINTYVHRIRREDVLHDLPPLTERVVRVPLDKKERTRYNKLKEELILELSAPGAVLTVPTVLACLTRLRQLVDSPRVLGVEEIGAKEKAGKELIELWLEDRENKILVFAEYAEVVENLAREFPGRSLVITGKTSATQRLDILRKFTNAASDHRLLFGTSALQYGLNIQEANKILHYSMPWTHARLEQRNGRSWRHGQVRPVESVCLLSEGTIDDKMYNLVQNKKKLTTEDLVMVLKNI